MVATSLQMAQPSPLPESQKASASSGALGAGTKKGTEPW